MIYHIGLSRGPTARADKLISVNFLQGLQEDYCTDLLKDTTMFLQKLDTFEGNLNICHKDFLFTMDFEQLYDFLSRDLAIMALKEAISVHRPCWSEDIIDWLTQSVILSLDSAAGEFGQNLVCQLVGSYVYIWPILQFLCFKMSFGSCKSV